MRTIINKTLMEQYKFLLWFPVLFGIAPSKIRLYLIIH